MGVGINATPKPLYFPKREVVPIVQEEGWASGPFWTGAEYFDHTGIRFPNRLSCRYAD